MNAFNWIKKHLKFKQPTLMDEEEEMQGLEIASEEDLIEIGNAILENIGIKQRVSEPEDMISDQFYLLVFEEAFP